MYGTEYTGVTALSAAISKTFLELVNKSVNTDTAPFPTNRETNRRRPGMRFLQQAQAVCAETHTWWHSSDRHVIKSAADVYGGAERQTPADNRSQRLELPAVGLNLELSSSWTWIFFFQDSVV